MNGETSVSSEEEKKETESRFEKLFEKITADVEEDLAIDEIELDTALLQNHKLFAKWRNKLSIESMNLTVLTNTKNTLYKKLFLYYLKKAPDKLYVEKGAVGLIIPKSDVNIYIHADQEWINHTLRMDYQTQLVRYIENIMTRITSRQHEIREIIKWRVFMAGEH
jgi:hypothetical protein